MRNKNILLVGGTGYIGWEIYQAWKPHNTVHYTGRRPPSRCNSTDLHNYRYLDLSNEESIRKTLLDHVYDYIIFLAAQVHIDMKTAPDTLSPGDALYESNVKGIENFMDVAAPLSASIIYFSSMTVYDHQNSPPVKEGDILRPFHTYGQSKMLGERKFIASVESASPSGAIVRIPGIFGGHRQGGYIHYLLQKFSEGAPVFLDVGSVTYWETMYIYDLLGMLEDWMQNYHWSSPYCEVFNLGYGEPTDFVETAYLLKKLTRSPSTIKLSQAPTYSPFYMDNAKISQYWAPTRTYEYSAALQHYITESLT